MAYIIYNGDGDILLTMPDGEIDSSTTSLDLIGKNVNNYGQSFNNNMVKLLTSFASADGNQPLSPQIGQLWFNKTSSRLTVYDGDSFKPTYGSTVAGTSPITTSTGDLWFDTINGQLNIWDGDEFQLVGPAVSTVHGRFGLTPPSATIRDYASNIPQKVGVFYSYGDAVALTTTSSFQMSANTSSVYFGVSTVTNVVKGLTVFNNLDVRGDVYVAGNRQVPPNKTLAVNYDISPWGTPNNPTAINNGNVAIAADLEMMFPLSTSTYNTYYYPVGSEVRVLCQEGAGGATSVRRFIAISGPLRWAPNTTLYYSTSTAANNIVV
jgi:hypothetical protein